MRITNLMIQNTLTSGIRGRLAAVARAASQVASGLRVQTVSDDPVDAASVLRLNSQLADIDQFRRNGTFATAQLSVEDTALSSLKDVLQQAKTLAMAATATDPNDPTRLAALATVRQLRDQVVGLGNTRSGDQYIFGGDRSTTPPFTPAGVYVGDANTSQIAINDGVNVTLTHAGQPLFTDALSSLDDLITQLQTGTPAQIQGTVTNLQNATQETLETQSETGTRLKEIQDASARLATIGARVADRRDGVQAVDPATAVVQLQNEQTALERAYAVVGRVLQTTLNDYLK